ncbi:uncharacterized protein [Anabrus simplex]|uniref:uncharacterized protein n=1 Tax=Anabrus simplex TaxID=316456 RepID=UPI0035A3BB02
MASGTIASLRGLLGLKSRPSIVSQRSRDDSLEPVPTVGFRVSFQCKSRRLQVTVIGARHLPAKLPGLVADNYIVKLRVFPGSEKFETKPKPESWPTFNETFTFPLAALGQDPTACLIASRFLMLSVYAVENERKKKAVGAVTWPLDRASFKDGASGVLLTGDIWRRLQDIRSGLPANTQSQYKKEVRKNQLEVSLLYKPGDATAGEADTLEVTVNRLRWSLDSTREYEQKKAQLYVKLSILDGGGSCIRSRNSKPFAPSISVHLTPEEEQAVLDCVLPPRGPQRDAIACQLSLCTKPSMITKKLVLGRVRFGTSEVVEDEFEPALTHLGKALQAPGEILTEWHNLL